MDYIGLLYSIQFSPCLARTLMVMQWSYLHQGNPQRLFAGSFLLTHTASFQISVDLSFVSLWWWREAADFGLILLRTAKWYSQMVYIL